MNQLFAITVQFLIQKTPKFQFKLELSKSKNIKIKQLIEHIVTSISLNVKQNLQSFYQANPQSFLAFKQQNCMQQISLNDQLQPQSPLLGQKIYYNLSQEQYQLLSKKVQPIKPPYNIQLSRKATFYNTKNEKSMQNTAESRNNNNEQKLLQVENQQKGTQHLGLVNEPIVNQPISDFRINEQTGKFNHPQMNLSKKIINSTTKLPPISNQSKQFLSRQNQKSENKIYPYKNLSHNGSKLLQNKKQSNDKMSRTNQQIESELQQMQIAPRNNIAQKTDNSCCCKIM